MTRLYQSATASEVTRLAMKLAETSAVTEMVEVVPGEDVEVATAVTIATAETSATTEIAVTETAVTVATIVGAKTGPAVAKAQTG